MTQNAEGDTTPTEHNIPITVLTHNNAQLVATRSTWRLNDTFSDDPDHDFFTKSRWYRTLMIFVLVNAVVLTITIFVLSFYKFNSMWSKVLEEVFRPRSPLFWAPLNQFVCLE